MRIQFCNYNNNFTFTSCSRTYKKDTQAYPEQTRKDIGLSSNSKMSNESFQLSNLAGTKMNYVCKNICTLTHIFRTDIDWENLMEVLKKDYKDEKKVNVYSLAGSDGSEGYTFAMAVMDRLPKNQQSKYFKIKVSDIDHEVIRAAQSGVINSSATDFELMKYNLKNPKAYFKPTKNTFTIANNEETRFKNYSGYKPIPKLRNAVEFKQGDILDVMKKIDKSEMSVVMCRNVMPYLSQNYVQEIVKNADEKLKKGSLFIIGDFDYVTGIENLLLNSNFEKVQHNVYRKS
jgi:chemotaxis methyl-accepting protein methylase